MAALGRKPPMKWVIQLEGRNLEFTSIGSTVEATSVSDIRYVSCVERLKAFQVFVS
jgi:hypothetical protein